MDPKPDKECEKRGDIVLLSEIIANSIYGKLSIVETPSNLGLNLEHIINLAEVPITQFIGIWLIFGFLTSINGF